MIRKLKKTIFPLLYQTFLGKLHVIDHEWRRKKESVWFEEKIENQGKIYSVHLNRKGRYCNKVNLIVSSIGINKIE
jgi:hypothetical protein